MFACAAPGAGARALSNAISPPSESASPSVGGSRGVGDSWIQSRRNRLILTFIVSWSLGIAMTVVGAVSIDKCDEMSTEDQVSDV